MVCLAAAIVLFTGCQHESDPAVTPSYDDVLAKYFSYKDYEPVTLSRTGLTGKHLYLVYYNTFGEAVPGGNIPYISYSTGLESNYPVSSSSSASASVAALPLERSAAAAETESGTGGDYTEVPESIVKNTDFTGASRSASRAASTYSVTPITPEAGTTNKTFWVEGKDASGTAAVVQKSATLYAIGTYCYVWIMDDCYTETAATEASNKCTKSDAETMRDKFDKVYPAERYLMGQEPSVLYCWNGTQWEGVDLETACETGKKVNILMYDIGDDSTNGTAAGYVSWLDLYMNKEHAAAAGYTGSDIDYLSTNNECLCESIDSYFFNKDKDSLYSTMVHEFNHLIEYNMKKSLSSSCSGWYLECLSDLTKDALNACLTGSDDGQGAQARISNFINYYFFRSVIWPSYASDSSETGMGYADAYAFGLWIVRQYGGAAVLREISQNGYVNEESIANAVNAVNGTGYSFDDLFRQFLQAVTLSGNTQYSLNRKGAQSLTYTGTDGYIYSYPMNAIDMWSDTYSWALSDTYSKFFANTTDDSGKMHGPAVLKNVDIPDLVSAFTALGKPNWCNLDCYGFLITDVGTAASDEVTLSLAPTGMSTVQMCLMAK